MRAMPRSFIRMDSICDPNPKKRASVLQRMESNNEIIDARVRYANDRAAENIRKLDESLQKTCELHKKMSSQTIDRDAKLSE